MAGQHISCLHTMGNLHMEKDFDDVEGVGMHKADSVQFSNFQIESDQTGPKSVFQIEKHSDDRSKDEVKVDETNDQASDVDISAVHHFKQCNQNNNVSRSKELSARGSKGLNQDKSQADSSKRDRVGRAITQKVERLDNVTLNIAVTGNSGAGKSTFVNTIRGLGADDEGAASTGVTETTMTPQEYSHPTMPNVTIWDLPGIGTPNFRAKTYLSDVNFERYDFFIIITSERFKENDVNLAKAIRKEKKMFYFIRSKIDNDIESESKKKDFSRENVLSVIREDCKKNLEGVGAPEVFLISSLNLQEYDFAKLIDALKRDLPERKRNALIQCLPVYSIETLVRKKKYFEKIILLQAFGSCLGAMAPVPGLTLAVDYGIATSFFNKVFRSFGLDEKSLKRLATRVNVDQQHLKNALQSRFKDGVTVEVIGSLLKTPSMASLITIKTVLSAVILVGALPAGALSIGVMCHLLNKGLKEMVGDAEALLVAAGLDHM